MTGGLKENHWTPAVLGAALQDRRAFDEAGGGKILCNDSSRPTFESTKQKWLRWLRHYAAVIKATRSRNLFVFLQQNLQTNETPSLENKQTLVSFFLSSWWLCDVVSHTYTHTHSHKQTHFLPMCPDHWTAASLFLIYDPAVRTIRWIWEPPTHHPPQTHTHTAPPSRPLLWD